MNHFIQIICVKLFSTENMLFRKYKRYTMCNFERRIIKENSTKFQSVGLTSAITFSANHLRAHESHHPLKFTEFVI